MKSQSLRALHRSSFIVPTSFFKCLVDDRSPELDVRQLRVGRFFDGLVLVQLFFGSRRQLRLRGRGIGRDGLGHVPDLPPEPAKKSFILLHVSRLHVSRALRLTLCSSPVAASLLAARDRRRR